MYFKDDSSLPIPKSNKYTVKPINDENKPKNKPDGICLNWSLTKNNKTAPLGIEDLELISYIDTTTLNQWELDFVNSIKKVKRKLSEKQFVIVKRIVDSQLNYVGL